jgi:hypothetical protein
MQAVDVVAELSFDPPLTPERLEAVRTGVVGRCLAFDKVELQTTFVAESGRIMLCHYKAPDAESVRIALRQAGIEFQRVWRAAVHGSTMPVT